MLDYAHLDALLAVEREGSFEGAAKALGVTSSAVSQRIRLLEERIGAVALNRQAPIKPTPIGSTLCRHAEMVSMLESHIIHSNEYPFQTQDRQPIQVKIVVNDDSLSSWFLDVMEEEAKAENPYNFEISIADQDHSIEEMKHGAALAAICGNKNPVQGFRSTFLGMHAYKATTSPAFMERYFSDGVTPETLKRAPALRYSHQDDLQQQWIEQVFGAPVPHGSHTLPSSQGFVSACRKGIAWGMNPALMVDELIEQGELCELIPGAVLNKPLYWHCSRIIAAPLQKFTQRVIQVANSRLDQSTRPRYAAVDGSGSAAAS